ncbi:YbaB/EbfC family nucleoid-associated protein [Christensenellaceae bacterium]|nr:YbaB/EbfC family nucleoid-associated protein [Christensenellaceae bacterium]BDF62200.1 YbaB/EbfC family nucleoid-associated protein [Christensenellaceae bacterium]
MAKGGFPGGMNMQNMMRQAQQMQARMQQVQEELEEREVEATAGGGVVRVVATGKKVIKSIEIKEEAVDPDDVEMLQDLIIAAVNEALAKADEMMQTEMGKVTGGMNLGGMF